jgi:hypothetical protein
MTNVILYNPTEASHADATTLVTFDNTIDESNATTNYNSGADPFSTGTGDDAGLRVGHTGSGSDDYRFLVRIEIPSNPKVSASGAAIKDKNLKITKVVLKLKLKQFSASGSGIANVNMKPIVRPPSVVDFTTMTWTNYDATNNWAETGGLGDGDADRTTDYGYGTGSAAEAGRLLSKTVSVGWNEFTIQSQAYSGPAARNSIGLDWGSTLDLIFNGTGYFDVSGKFGLFYHLETQNAANRPYVEVHYEDDTPTKPEITVTPDTDFHHAKVSFTSRPDDDDLTQFVAVHRSDGSDPTYETGSSSPNFGLAVTDTGKEFYHGFDDFRNGGIASTNYFPGTFSVAGSSNRLTFFAEDANNTGATNSTQGNVAVVPRYTPYTEEDFGDSDFADSCSVNWILIGKATAGSTSSFTDTTSGTDTPWLRGQFLKNNVEVGDKVWNDTDGVYATISGVTNTTVSGTLSGGGNWATNDVYQIIRKVDVGEKVTLTIRTTRVDGLKFDKIGVNWNNTVAADAISDTPITSTADYDIIELNAPTTEHTISFRYSTAGTYYPSFFFVDSTTGFRSKLVQMGMTTGATGTDRLSASEAALVVEQPKPIPKLTSSKTVGESANVALDRGSAVVYSGANSTVGGSDAFIKEWRWLGDPAGGQILTQGCLDIDNTPLIDESKRLYLRCNSAGYNATVFTIYGLASFQADNATSVKDTDTTFSHYRYVKATVSAGAAKYLKHDTSGAFGNAAAVGGVFPYFKQVDFVYATTKSGTSGTEEVFQLLAADSDNDDAIDVAGTLDINTVCKRLCIDSNNGSPGYKWGGLISVTGSSNITFTKHSGADEIESTAIDFIAAGFGPGDTITVENSSNDGVYTIQKIETVSGTHSLYLNEELPVAESGTSATIFTTQPSISVAASAAGSAKISLDVKDNLSSTAVAPVSVFTTFRDQTNLDLNATADSGFIAIQNASLTRSGGISAAMPLGERRYPPNAVHTRHGLPRMNMTIRVIDSTGFNRIYRLLNNSYNYAVYQHHDTTFASWVKYRLKIESFTINRDPQNLQHQVVDLSFFIVGEEV